MASVMSDNTNIIFQSCWLKSRFTPNMDRVQAMKNSSILQIQTTLVTLSVSNGRILRTSKQVIMSSSASHAMSALMVVN